MSYIQRKQKVVVLKVFICVGLVCLFSGCTEIGLMTQSFRSTGVFHSLASDHRIHIEEGAEAFGRTVGLYLPVAVRQVETRQYTKFPPGVHVYVMASEESYYKATRSKNKTAMMDGKVYLSPVIMKEQYRLQQYLAYEMSHLLLYLHIGPSKLARIPAWFREGLANYASNGAGAYMVTDDRALEAIKFGKHFKPYDRMWGKDIFSDKAIGLADPQRQMYARQAMLFVKYLHFRNEEKFRELVMDLHVSQPFAASFEISYGYPVKNLWTRYKNIGIE
ncbi:MAG: hypothetical protein K8S27_01825 [Candidatus Omnitrophica bacterium]|nr:hypothetical protein [Candidatus Omnitrophota bacterium]